MLRIINGFGVRLELKCSLHHMSFDGSLTSLNFKFFSVKENGGVWNEVYCSELDIE